MKNHCITIVAMAGVAALVGLSACRHKPVCERLAAKNRSCAEAFARYVDSKADQWNQSHPIPRTPGSPNPRKTGPATPRAIGGPSDRNHPGTQDSTQSRASDKTARPGPLTRAEAIRRMRTERRKAAKKGLRKLFTSKLFLDACRKAWTGNEQEDNRLKKAAKDCLAVSDCDAYVSCIMHLRRTKTKSTLTPGE